MRQHAEGKGNHAEITAVKMDSLKQGVRKGEKGGVRPGMRVRTKQLGFELQRGGQRRRNNERS